MLHWQSQGSAILPDRRKDRNGVHSGAVLNIMGNYIYFTLAVIKIMVSEKSRQCIAISEMEKHL